MPGTAIRVLSRRRNSSAARSGTGPVRYVLVRPLRSEDVLAIGEDVRKAECLLKGPR